MERIEEVLGVLREYARDAGAAVIAFLGGLLMLLLTLARGYLERRWSVVLPPEVTIGGGVLLMIGGQFRAYLNLRKRFPIEPEIDEALELLGSKLRLLSSSKEDEERRRLFNLDPDPDHLLEVTFGVLAEISNPLVVECTGPIYKVGAYWKDAREDEGIFSIDHDHLAPERVRISMVHPPLSSRSVFQVQLYVSGEQTRLRRALVSKPPAARPPTKSGS